MAAAISICKDIAALEPGRMIPLPFLAEVLDLVAHGSEAENRQVLDALGQKGRQVLEEHRGTEVYYRGLLEFSNLCARDCHYCGIGASNRNISRFTLDIPAMVETARWCAENGYGSLTLQSGERNDPAFTDLVTEAVQAIKAATTGSRLPEGLGITLCVGEQSRQVLEGFLEAGAHRYLLRVETTNPRLYAELHPETDGGLAQRTENLRLLKELGFQVGSGVMIGLPGQTTEDLARDLHFFVEEGIHMVGMGPYLPHRDRELTRQGCTLLEDRRRFGLGLAMVSLTRILLPRANIAATTALQALNPLGRELGLEHGANILMPLVTPSGVRESYQLYDNKPCIDDGLEECRDCLASRVARTRRPVAYDAWGDSLMAPPRKGTPGGAGEES